VILAAGALRTSTDVAAVAVLGAELPPPQAVSGSAAVSHICFLNRHIGYIPFVLTHNADIICWLERSVKRPN
jgi:hypothetical protein